MLRLESVVTALLGAALGVLMVSASVAIIQRAPRRRGLRKAGHPVAQLASSWPRRVIGVLAAVWLGRRAARVDILRAIATE